MRMLADKLPEMFLKIKLKLTWIHLSLFHPCKTNFYDFGIQHVLVLCCHGDAVGPNFFSQALTMKFFLKTVLINFSSTSTSLSLKLFSPFVSHLIYSRSLSFK